MRYLLTITYDGANFCGWQRQAKSRTIQAEIERAIEILVKQSVNVVGSGRTDAGVNAYAQKAHFDVENEIADLNKFVYSLNGILPEDVKIISAEQTDVHARFSAKNKTYLYKLYLADFIHPLKNKALRVDKNINIKAMEECAKMLEGNHDFKNLACVGSEVESTERTIFSIKFVKKDDDVDIFVSGNGFLYKMVRNIVGLLLEVGKGNISTQDFHNLAFKGEYPNKKTAPAHALFLYNVEYN